MSYRGLVYEVVELGNRNLWILPRQQAERNEAVLLFKLDRLQLVRTMCTILS